MTKGMILVLGVLMAIILIITIIGFIMTLLVIRDVNGQIKKYESSGDTLQNEVARSHDYETSSLKTSVKSLSWINIILWIVIIIIALAFVLFGKYL